MFIRGCRPLVWMHRCGAIALMAVLAVTAAGTASAQDQAEDPRVTLAKSIHWQQGPCRGSVGHYAEIDVPEGFMFAGPADAQKFMELNENIPDPMTMGVLQPIADDETWFLVFEYGDTGHVHDDEKTKIDADALLKHKQAVEVRANEERRKRGYVAMHCKDWLIRPAYDADTRSLAWALRLEVDGPDGKVSEVCNYNLRILGRSGVMSTTLVCAPQEISGLVPRVKQLLKGFEYVPGQRYGEWRAGDKVAAYGLTGLITGGAAVAAVKSGLAAKLLAAVAKMGKVIFLAVIAIFGGICKLLFGGRKEPTAK
jgi:uncharacterized membrane-anchored protein